MGGGLDAISHPPTGVLWTPQSESFVTVSVRLVTRDWDNEVCLVQHDPLTESKSFKESTMELRAGGEASFMLPLIDDWSHFQRTLWWLVCLTLHLILSRMQFSKLCLCISNQKHAPEQAGSACHQRSSWSQVCMLYGLALRMQLRQTWACL